MASRYQQSDPTNATDALVIFMPSGRRGRFPHGTPLLDAARSLGVYIGSVCGGRGLCTRCQVEPALGVFAKHSITSSIDHLVPQTAAETDFMARGRLAATRRLSCQAKILGDLVIEVPPDAQSHQAVVRKRAEARSIVADPAVRLYQVTVPPADFDTPTGDVDRLVDAVRQAGDFPELDADFSLLPDLQKTLRKSGWAVTALVSLASEVPRLIGVSADPPQSLAGLAVDIGSTTIAAHLVDLASGRTIASAGTANPQVRFGEDLMSRVSYVMMNEGGEAALTQVVREAVQTLIAKTVADAGIDASDIVDITVVGNPVMHHLFLGLNPVELGQAPFALTISGAVRITAAKAGLTVHPRACLYLPPCIAGHVGADAAAAILAEGPQREDDVTLLVDIGTNAEIVLGNKSRILAASSPTGPAFEGAEISHGQRAAPGAIERVRIDPETLEPRLTVIGCELWSDDPDFAEKTRATGVTGICGSGIVEAIAEMFLAGIISEDGVIEAHSGPGADRIIADGRTNSYILWRGYPNIIVTQKDIRAIQLAKAALYAGVRLLMDRFGVSSVDRIRLAGAFGSYIDPKYAMVLGLIPDCDLAQVKAVGNAAGTGARMVLLNRGYRAEIEALVSRIEKVETATEPRFQEHFVNAMALPNKVEAFPCLATVVTLPERSTPAANKPVRRRRRRR